MLTQSQIDAIAEAVLQSLKADPSPENTKKAQTTEAEGLEDMTSPEVRGVPLLDHIEDREGLERMMARTTARIGVGNCGPRLKTRTMLTLRADHAAARDAVFKDVGQELLDRLGLFTVETRCKSKDEFLTRAGSWASVSGRKSGDDPVKMRPGYGRSGLCFGRIVFHSH